MSNNEKKTDHSVEKMFQEYLKKVGHDANKLSPVQYRELRRAFFGATGMFLNLQIEEVVNLPDEEGFKILDSLYNETKAFWENEVKNHLKKN